MAEQYNLTEEVNQLRAQVNQLRDELERTRKERGETRKSSTDSFRDAARRGTDAKSQLFRGVTLASLEGLRLAANVMNAFTDEVLQRNRPKEGESATAQDLIRDLPGDLISGFSRAVEEVVDIPRRTAEKFSEAYKEGERS